MKSVQPGTTCNAEKKLSTVVYVPHEMLKGFFLLNETQFTIISHKLFWDFFQNAYIS